MTKGEVLLHLQNNPLGVTINIPKLIVISYSQRLQDSQGIFSMMKENFPKDTVILRSSHASEDMRDTSNAGVFISIPDIQPDCTEQEFHENIERIFMDYKYKGVLDGSSQIIIQQQITNVQYAGVLFSKDNTTHAPYYCISYSDLGDTHKVTSGIYQKTIHILHDSMAVLPSDSIRCQAVIDTARALKNIVDSQEVDVEFCIDDKNILYILQCRPLVMPAENESDRQVQEEIHRLISQYRGGSIYSNMAFWNPAELIGAKPTVFSRSLFYELIGKEEWSNGIQRVGYTPEEKDLFVNIGGGLYVDTAVAFSALCIQGVSLEIKNKLIDDALAYLYTHPHLHDKIEFDVMPNCYFMQNELNERIKKVLLPDEYNQFMDSLKKHTVSLINTARDYFDSFEKHIQNNLIVQENTTVLIKDALKKNDLYEVACILNNYIHTTKETLVRDFVTAARYYFIAQTLLPDPTLLCKEGTVVTQIMTDFNKLSKEDFLHQHGHLRMGTYNPLSPNYHVLYDSIKITDSSIKPSQSHDNTDDIYTQHIDHYADDLGVAYEIIASFLEKATYYREKLKHEYTKNINLLIETIREMLPILGIVNNTDIQHIDSIFLITLLRSSSASKWYTLLTEHITENRVAYERDRKIMLSGMIKSVDDFSICIDIIHQPNYVTNKTVTGAIIKLTPKSIQQHNDMMGKIVCIESADPGYDRIFGMGIAGLVTNYGGKGSHMAIRCNELGLPAMIGCGSGVFNHLIDGKMMTIDCASRTFHLFVD